ncbi:MAG: hypothetical protein ACFB2W_00970 [Leptolyngbyaceae cyanobacterium]
MTTKTLILYRVNGGAVAGVNINSDLDPVKELSRLLKGQLRQGETAAIKRIVNSK